MNNKKGFTLIELLVVIAILAIIGVIVVNTVSDTLEKSTIGAFKSNYDILYKEVETRIQQEKLGMPVTITCDDTDDDTSNDCSKLYDISEEDYHAKVTKVNDSYSLCVEGKGKFEDMDIDGNKTKALYTLFNDDMYNKVSIKNIEQGDFFNEIEEITEVPDKNEKTEEYIEFVGQKTANYIYKNAPKLVSELIKNQKECIDNAMNATQRANCRNTYDLRSLNKTLLYNNLPGKISGSSRISDDYKNIELYVDVDMTEKIEKSDKINEIVGKFLHKDSICYLIVNNSMHFRISIEKINDSYTITKYVDNNDLRCLGRN